MNRTHQRAAAPQCQLATSLRASRNDPPTDAHLLSSARRDQFGHHLGVLILTFLVSVTNGCFGCNNTEGLPSLPPSEGPAVDAGQLHDAGSLSIASISLSPQTNQCFTEELAWFRVYAYDLDGERSDITGDVTWQVSDPSIAAIKAAGVFYCIEAGSTTLEVHHRDFKATATLTVVAPDEGVTSVAIEPSVLALPRGYAQPIHAIAFYSDGSARDVSELALWSVDDPAIAELAYTTGSSPQITAIAEGVTTARMEFSGFSNAVEISVLPADLQSIELIPADVTVPMGSSVQMTAMGFFSDGPIVDITSSLHWTVSDSSVATVDDAPESKGLVTGAAEGTALITAATPDDTVSKSAPLTVTPVYIDALEITPAFIQLPVGTSIELTASAVLTDDIVVDVTNDANWELVNPNLAFLSPTQDGSLKLEGVLQGTTTLMIEYAGMTREAPVMITEASLVHGEILPLDWSVPVGSDLQFYFFGTYSDGVRLDLTTQANWGTSHPEIAYSSIEDPGLFSGLTVGTTTISASFEGWTEETTFEVTDAELVSVEIYPPLMTVPAGEHFQFEAIAVFSDDTQQNVTQDAQWQTENGTIATISNAIDNRGIVTGIEAGIVEVSVDFMGQTDTATLTVSDAVVEQIIITPIWVVVYPGRTQQARAYAQYSNGITHEITSQAAWSVVNPYIAQVSNQDGSRGVIGGIAEGYTDVYAHYGGQYGIRHVIVPEQDFDQVTIYPEEPVMVPGVSEQLVLVGTYDDYPFFYQDLTADAFWTSDYEERVTVDNYPFGAGRITAHESGVVSITATFGNLSDSVTFDVKNREMTELNLSPPNPVLPINAIRGMISLARYDDDTVYDVTGDTVFTSSDPSIVTFFEFYQGYYVGLREGTATITATLGEFNAETTVTVTNLEPQQIFIAPVEPLINHYASTQFYVTALYEDGSSGDITYLCTWMSSDAFVLLVVDEPYAKGWAYGQNLGTAVVSVDCGGLTAETVVTVH